jgi:hypothetical protein
VQQIVVGMLEESVDLSELSSIGNDLAGKIDKIVETGGLKQSKV